MQAAAAIGLVRRDWGKRREVKVLLRSCHTENLTILAALATG